MTETVSPPQLGPGRNILDFTEGGRDKPRLRSGWDALPKTVNKAPPLLSIAA